MVDTDTFLPAEPGQRPDLPQVVRDMPVIGLSRGLGVTSRQAGGC